MILDTARRLATGRLALKLPAVSVGVYLRAWGLSGRGYNLAGWETSTGQGVDYLQPEPSAGSRYQHGATVLEIHDSTRR